MAAEWASIETEATLQRSVDEPSVVNYWDKEDGRTFLLKTVSGETLRMKKFAYLQAYAGTPVFEITHAPWFDRRQTHLAAVAARRFERRLS
jgi:hypothetical protein